MVRFFQPLSFHRLGALASIIFLSLVLAACGGGSSTSTPAATGNTTPITTPTASLGAIPGPSRAATCPSANTTALACTIGNTPASPEQLTAITGTYGALFVTNTGTVYYGSSPTAYTPTRGICQGSSASLVTLYFDNTNNSRLIFTIGSSSVTVTGNVPNAANTSLTDVTQTSCQY